jgi:hypothetical protein
MKEAAALLTTAATVATLLLTLQIGCVTSNKIVSFQMIRFFMLLWIASKDE